MLDCEKKPLNTEVSNYLSLFTIHRYKTDKSSHAKCIDKFIYTMRFSTNVPFLSVMSVELMHKCEVYNGCILHAPMSTHNNRVRFSCVELVKEKTLLESYVAAIFQNFVYKSFKEVILYLKLINILFYNITYLL